MAVDPVTIISSMDDQNPKKDIEIEQQLNDKPKLKYLNRYVTCKVCSVWYKLGLELLDDEDISLLDNINADHHGDCEASCMKMFKKWCEIKPEASWKQLIDALQYIKQNTLAKQLLDYFHTKYPSESVVPLSSTEQQSSTEKGQSVIESQAPTPLLYEVERLKVRYKRRQQHSQCDWPKHSVSKYIKLALIEKEDVTRKAEHLNEVTKLSLRGSTDKILKKKKPLDGLNEIFHYKNKPCPRLILVMGGPGIGKTTLANEICIKWATEGFLADDFDAVILISLRSVQKIPLEEMIKEEFGEKNYQKLEESIGKKCLIILEGLDEMATVQQENRFFIKLINCYIFEAATILITSRPHACTKLTVDRKIEVIGFGKAEIEEFAKESLGGGVEFKNFLCQLQDRSYLISLCYVPLSLVMIVDIFKEKKSTLPSTLTKLYQEFIVMILQRPRHIKKITYSVAASSNIEAQVCTMLEGIPTGAVRTVCALSELAYHSFFGWYSQNEFYKSWGDKRQPKIIFMVEDLEHCGFQVTDDFDGLGLLKATYVHEGARGDSCTYNFVHLSIQECLCALYIATLSAEEQLQIYKKHHHHSSYHNIFALYSGITQLSCEEVLEEVIIDLTERDHCAAARRFIFESQSGPPQSVSLFTFDNSIVPFLPYDILCISYVLSHYPVTKLSMQYSQLDDEQIELLANHYKGNKVLKILDLSNNSLTNEGMKYVMKIITSSPSLKKLNISKNVIHDKGMLVIANDFQCNSGLTELLLGNCNLSAKGVEYIKQRLPMLQYLDICNNSIGDDGLRHITESLESSNSMLTELHMQKCDLSTNGITHLKILLEKSKRLQCLNVSFNSIGNDGVKCIKDGLEQNDTLIKLNISSCKVKGDENIRKIVEGNVKLQCLDISNNSIGDDGVQHISQGLQDNDALTELNMSSCRFSAKAAGCIKKIIIKDTIQSLIIGGNRICDNGMKQLAEGFQHNHSLTILKLYRCLLTEEGAITISKMIKENYTLQRLDIRDNSIGDKGIEAIAQQLVHTRLIELNVAGCGFTDTGAKSLADGIKNNHTIGILDVLYNFITVDGARLILEATTGNGICWWMGINQELIDANIELKRMMNTIDMRRGIRVSSDDD